MGIIVFYSESLAYILCKYGSGSLKSKTSTKIIKKIIPYFLREDFFIVKQGRIVHSSGREYINIKNKDDIQKKVYYNNKIL